MKRFTWMNMTVNLSLGAFDSSTPFDNLEWNTDADSSTVFFPGGHVTLDGKSKNTPLHSVEDVFNCQPVVASTPAVEEATRFFFADEELSKKIVHQESNSVTEILNFANMGIRNCQPFSPSSGSEAENSVFELVEDTISAPIDNQLMPEVEVDLASQFEKLILSKQPSAEDRQSMCQKTLQSGKEMSALVFNQAVSVEAEICKQQMNQAVSPTEKTFNRPIDQQVSLETEVNIQPEESGLQLRTMALLSTQTSEPSTEDKVPEAINQRFPLSEYDKENIQGSKHLIDDPIVSASSSLKGVSDSSNSSSVSDQSIQKPNSLPDEKPIIAKKGYDLSFLEKFDNLENATPSFSHAKLPIPPSALASIQPPFTPENEPMKEKSNDRPLCAGNKDNANFNATFAADIQDKTASKLTDTPDEAVSQVCDPSSAEKTGDLSCQGTSKKSNQTNVETACGAISIAFSTLETEIASDKNQLFPSDKVDKSLDDTTKNEAATCKPIRPRLQRPAALPSKPNTFEIEFKFDPDDDPFKPKTKLVLSPTKGETPTSAFSQSAFEDSFPSLEANSTVNATDGSISNEANNTVIDTMAEQHPGQDSVASKISSIQAVDQEEEFRPAQEVFRDASDLDFLMQHGGSSHEIALARQSLFVKFDPLVGGRPSILATTQLDGAVDETIVVEEQSLERKSMGESLFLFSPPHGNGVRTEKKEKGLDVQHPPIIDCLMSLNSRMVADDVVGIHEHREALKHQELLFQDKLLQKDREIQAKQNDNQQLKAKLEEGSEAQTRLKLIVAEYEKTISQLIADKEREKASMETTLQNTIKERDEAIEDLKEVERAFSEFHRMYERNRTATGDLQRNEEVLKKTVASFQEKLQKEQQKYETLKLQSAEMLEKALQEMDNMKRTLEAESSQVKAQLKKTEMRVASVETNLEQKSKENQELTKLCDELIIKLGTAKQM